MAASRRGIGFDLGGLIGPVMDMPLPVRDGVYRIVYVPFSFPLARHAREKSAQQEHHGNQNKDRLIKDH